MKKEKSEKLHEAVELVNTAIMARYQQLQGIANIEENDPVLLEGETTKGYYCQLMINPKRVAEIMLQYDYPMYDVLGEEAPLAMWDDIAAWFGLGKVESVAI